MAGKALGPEMALAAEAILTVFLRLALGAGFLSAVADRLGVWGAPGTRNVAWGDFERFVDYTGVLNPYFPPAWVPALAWLVTVAEVAVGIALLLGFRTRSAAIAGGILLLLFAIGMSIGTGVKTALDASVFAASGAAFALATFRGHPLSLDRLRR